MTIDERIEELKKLRRDIGTEIRALEALAAGLWSPPKPGDSCGAWGVDEHHNLVHTPTGAAFTIFNTDAVAAALHVNKAFDPQTDPFICDWLTAARAGYYLTEEAR